jgi:hypothetical protein
MCVIATVTLEDTGMQHLDICEIKAQTSDQALGFMLVKNTQRGYKGNKLQMWTGLIIHPQETEQTTK